MVGGEHLPRVEMVERLSYVGDHAVKPFNTLVKMSVSQTQQLRTHIRVPQRSVHHILACEINDYVPEMLSKIRVVSRRV